MKNNLITYDKYYTPTNVAKYCFDKTLDIIGKKNISYIIESSAGNGAFLKHIENSYVAPYMAIDIEPESDNISKYDFFKLHEIFPYKKGCLIGFNPPFGKGGTLYKKFYN